MGQFQAPGHDHGSLLHNMIETNTPHFIYSIPNELQNKKGVLNCLFRFQHRGKLVNCMLVKQDSSWTVYFEKYIRALTPGQVNINFEHLLQRKFYTCILNSHCLFCKISVCYFLFKRRMLRKCKDFTNWTISLRSFSN